jgi:hypothetical protein
MPIIKKDLQDQAITLITHFNAVSEPADRRGIKAVQMPDAPGVYKLYLAATKENVGVFKVGLDRAINDYVTHSILNILNMSEFIAGTSLEAFDLQELTKKPAKKKKGGASEAAGIAGLEGASIGGFYMDDLNPSIIGQAPKKKKKVVKRKLVDSKEELDTVIMHPAEGGSYTAEECSVSVRAMESGHLVVGSLQKYITPNPDDILNSLDKAKILIFAYLIFLKDFKQDGIIGKKLIDVAENALFYSIYLPDQVADAQKIASMQLPIFREWRDIILTPDNLQILYAHFAEVIKNNAKTKIDELVSSIPRMWGDWDRLMDTELLQAIDHPDKSIYPEHVFVSYNELGGIVNLRLDKVFSILEKIKDKNENITLLDFITMLDPHYGHAFEEWAHIKAGDKDADYSPSLQRTAFSADPAQLVGARATPSTPSQMQFKNCTGALIEINSCLTAMLILTKDSGGADKISLIETLMAKVHDVYEQIRINSPVKDHIFIVDETLKTILGQLLHNIDQTINLLSQPRLEQLKPSVDKLNLIKNYVERMFVIPEVSSLALGSSPSPVRGERAPTSSPSTVDELVSLTAAARFSEAPHKADVVSPQGPPVLFSGARSNGCTIAAPQPTPTPATPRGDRGLNQSKLKVSEMESGTKPPTPERKSAFKSPKTS